MKGTELKVVWYRKTEEEARELAASKDQYQFIGLGYNPKFPDLWAVKVYDKADEFKGDYEEVGC